MVKKNIPQDISYKSYLHLNTVLQAQQPISASHDEMLFIIVHQTYELWFKQLLFEMGRIQTLFTHEHVDDKDLRVISAGLERMVEILKHLVRQIDILETMTPLDFLDFRHVFRAASGFQSMQFRELELRLGLRTGERVAYEGRPYESFMPAEDQEKIKELEKKRSLFELLDRWLSRTPFLSMGNFDFWKAYRQAVSDMIGGDRQAVLANANFGAETRQVELNKLDNLQKQFDQLFSADESKEKMHWRLSSKAVQAGLFITLYRDQPVLQAPFKILSLLMDIDEIMTLWRYRHALMAQRMLGMKWAAADRRGMTIWHKLP